VWLNRVTPQRQAEEIDRSLDFLSSRGAPTRDWIMCYPYGAYDRAVREHLRERKCAVGLTSKVAVADLATHPILELPRLDTNDVPLGA
jgi:hypothetical protein